MGWTIEGAWRLRTHPCVAFMLKQLKWPSCMHLPKDLFHQFMHGLIDASLPKQIYLPMHLLITRHYTILRLHLPAIPCTASQIATIVIMQLYRVYQHR